MGYASYEYRAESSPAGANSHSIGPDGTLLSKRRTLFRSTLGVVEDYHSFGPPASLAVTGYSPEFQVALPYTGLFLWRVGRSEVVIDPCQALYVTGAEEFAITEPVPGGYRELILTPAPELLSEILGVDAAGLAQGALFLRKRAPAHPALLLMRARAASRETWSAGSGLSGDEALVDLVRHAMHCRPAPELVRGPTRRLVDRAKQFIGQHFAESLWLTDVARAVGASPAYLTDVFRRSEGASLHQYMVQLRLARALVDLPHASDLTTLALDLGFSSHSHFSAAFRRAFGCTPSAFRASTSGVVHRTEPKTRDSRRAGWPRTIRG